MCAHSWRGYRANTSGCGRFAASVFHTTPLGRLETLAICEVSTVVGCVLAANSETSLNCEVMENETVAPYAIPFPLIHENIEESKGFFAGELMHCNRRGRDRD